MLSAALLLTVLQAGEPQSPALRVRFIGNEGFALSDGRTTLVTDLPYQPGAFGYMSYDPASLPSEGRVVSLISHRHADHWDRDLFLERDWIIIGPAEVTNDLPSERVIDFREVIEVGDFTVVPHRTGHGDTEHYSYLVTWRGRRLYFVGDTEDASHILSVRDLDIAFVTRWLGCTAGAFGRPIDADQLVLYHHREGEGTLGCFEARVMEQGEWFTAVPPP